MVSTQCWEGRAACKPIGAQRGVPSLTQHSRAAQRQAQTFERRPRASIIRRCNAQSEVVGHSGTSNTTDIKKQPSLNYRSACTGKNERLLDEVCSEPCSTVRKYQVMNALTVTLTYVFKSTHMDGN